MTSYGLFPMITFPTRFCDTTATLIDNTFTKVTSSGTSGILLPKFSDHQPHFSLFSFPTTTKKKYDKFIEIQQRMDAAAFVGKLEAINFENLLNSPDDVDVNAQSFINLLTRIKKECTPPPKRVRFNKYKHPKLPWVTPAILKMIKDRDSVYEKYLRAPNGSPIKYFFKEDARNRDKIIRSTLRSAEKKYYECLFLKYKHDIKSTWNAINEILGKKKNKNAGCDSFCFVHEGKNITDLNEIANLFNQFFSQIGHEYANNLMNTPDGYKKYFENQQRNENVLIFNHVSETDVLKIISSLSPKTSFGYDLISTKLLQFSKLILCKPLTTLINQSISQSKFPDCLKIAKVVPIYKKDDKKLFSNYRPISLLPSISKVFEKVISSQLTDFFVQNDLFFGSQYGYRTKHSTTHAGIELVDRIQKLWVANEIPLCIFLDLSKAFDTLNYDVLLWKLSFYGVRGSALQLIKDYLTNRKQFVSFNGSESDLLPLNIGVPQGSILGPLLFIIYTNDIHTSSSLFDFILYADDTSLVSTKELLVKSKLDPTAISSEFLKVTTWLIENRLSLNGSKTMAMLFHHQNKKNVMIPEIQYGDTPVKFTKEFKFLGLVLDSSLSWKPHITYLSKKLMSAIGALNRVKHFLNSDIKLKIYSALFHSFLNYGTILWGDSNSFLKKLQNRALRLVLNRPYNSAHTESMYKITGVLKLEDIYVLTKLKLYNDFKIQQVPKYISEIHLGTNLDSIPNYPNTRNANNIHRIHSHPKSLPSIIPQTVASLPNDIKRRLTHPNHLFSTDSVAKLYKKMCLDEYSSVEICHSEECWPCNKRRT